MEAYIEDCKLPKYHQCVADIIMTYFEVHKVPDVELRLGRLVDTVTGKKTEICIFMWDWNDYYQGRWQTIAEQFKGVWVGFIDDHFDEWIEKAQEAARKRFA